MHFKKKWKLSMNLIVLLAGRRGLVLSAIREGDRLAFQS